MKVAKEFTDEFPDNFVFAMPAGYKQYSCNYDWHTSEDSLLNSYCHNAFPGQDEIKNVFLFRKDQDSSKVRIITNEKTPSRDYGYSKHVKYYIKNFYKGVYQSYKTPVIVEGKMRIFGADTLYSSAYVFYPRQQNYEIMCYDKAYHGLINNVPIWFSYVRYTRKQELVDSVAANSDNVLGFFVKQMMANK